jgi:hypothetical protein
LITLEPYTIRVDNRWVFSLKEAKELATYLIDKYKDRFDIIRVMLIGNSDYGIKIIKSKGADYLELINNKWIPKRIEYD